MDLDEDPKKPDDPLILLTRADLSSLSVDELRERVNILQGEIDRTKTLIDSKNQSLAAAEAFFKKTSGSRVE